MAHLRETVNNMPLEPGVYFMKDAEGEILYIGKAKVLRNRVRSYLINKMQFPKIVVLMSHVQRIDYVETSTEVDALLLEAQLVRQYMPKYNAELKDDKSFPLLKITSDAFPRLVVTRNRKDKSAIYYGPYTDAKLLREAVSLMNDLFPIRKCRRLPKTACLYYHIGQCIAPCIKPEVKPEYDALVDEVRQFLGGGKKSFVDYLNERMQQAAREFRFEDAQFFKEQIAALGKLKKKRYSLHKPEGGIGLTATLELKRILGMEKLPEKIVCFDVSNIQGDQAVASRVAFQRELPDKINYRRYKIRTVKGINDYAMIQEAVRRMLVGIKEGRESFIPDVIMIDGGKGHLSAAAEVLKEQGFENTELISIAKRFETIYSGKKLLAGEVDAGEDLLIPRDASANHLLQKVRDEAHRFAINYHRTLMEKGVGKSELDEIHGIGEKRKVELLKHFDSLDELKRAGVEQLAGLPGMTRSSAETVWNYFHAPKS